MRFLILTQYYPPEIGAPPLRLNALARELKAAGHEVEVVTSLPNHPTGRIFPEYAGSFYRREHVDGIVVHRVWLYAALGAGLRRIANYLSFTVTCSWALIKAQKPDYVFVESPPLFLSIPGFLVARLRGARLIFNVADLWPDSVRQLGLLKDGIVLRVAERLERWSYRVANSVNAATEGIRAALVKKGVSPGKVLFLPNGVDTDVFHPREPDEELARELGIVGKKLVVYAGTHGFAHGLEVALKAADLLRTRTDLLFVFVGDGSEKEKLVRMAGEMGLENVLFLNAVPPEYVARLYSLAQVGLSTLRNSSLFEGTRPVKVYGVMASGVPVAYCGQGEGERLVRIAQAGLSCPPEDPVALAQVIGELVDDPARAAQLGMNGRRFVEQHLGWSAVIANWLRELKAMEVQSNATH